MSKERKRSKSLILHFLDVFTSFFYKKLSGGFFGGLTRTYLRENNILSSSGCASVINGNSWLGNLVRKIRFIIAEQFEESRILRAWRRMILFLAGCKLRLYGAFFFTFGVYTALVYFIKPFIETARDADPKYLLWTGIMLAISLPMLMTPKTLAPALNESAFGHFLVSDVFGIPDEKLALPQSKHGDSYSIAIFLGVIAGSVSYFVSPIYVFAAIGIFITVALIMTTPEIGVVTSLTLLPLFSSDTGKEMLVMMIILYSFSYFVKLLRGKRILRFGVTDLLLVIFCFFAVLSGSLNIWGADASMTSGTVIIILGSIVAGNLMRTKLWQKRCVMSLIYSGFSTSLIMIFRCCTESFRELFDLNIGLSFLNESIFFGNGDYLAMFLAFTLVLTMTLIYLGEGAKHRFAVNVMAISMVFALVFTKSVWGLFGCVVALFVFFLIMSRKTITLSAFGLVIVPTVILILNGTTMKSVLASFGLTSQSTTEMIKIWRGSLDMLSASYFLGLGVGGFERIYPVYAHAGFEDATNAGALWLSILCDTGVLGLLLIGAAVLLVIKNCFGFMREGLGKDKKAFIAAGCCALIAMLVQSFFCDFCSQANLMYLFFAAICMITASIRSGGAELDKLKDENVNTESAATLNM